MYDISKIKDKIKQLNNEKPKTVKKVEGPKLQFWKPSMGMNVIRFLPYVSEDGQPFQEINYYNSKKLSERRLIAPIQFGMPDPIAELLESLRPQRSKKEVWLIMKELQMKPSYYAPIIVRGQEDKGIQIWEMNPTIVKDIYATLAHIDWVEEDLFDPEKGYDFTVEVSDSGKTFNEFMVKNYDLKPRRKPEPLFKKKEDREKIVDSIPNLLEHYKQFVKNEDNLKDLVANFLSQFEDVDETIETEDGLMKNSDSDDETVTEAKSKIEAAFDFDDDEEDE